MSLSVPSYRFESRATASAAAEVLAVHLEEALDEPYLLQLTLALPDGDVDVAELLGRDATLTIERAPLSRRICGLVRAVREGQRRPDGSVVVHAEVVPGLDMLRLRRDTRMFQERTVPEILQAVLQESLAPYGRTVELELSEDYPRREYCLQYQESDLAFVSRLMEEEGISYAFEHDESVERLLLFDRNEVAEPVPAAPAPGVAPYRPHSLHVAGGAGETGEPVHRLHRDHRSTATAVTLRDLDWTSGAPILEEARDGEDLRGRLRESYEHGEGRTLTIGDYDPGVRRYQSQDADRQARIRLQAHQVEGLVAHGVGRVIGFQPGRRFRLEGHPTLGADDDYLLTRVVHESRGVETDGGEGDREPYHNRFECIPMSAPHRPRRRTPKPRIMSAQTAIVTGPAGEEIHTDEHARVKVRFHWDRENPADETSSVWIRVKQAWTGAGWGALWLPRIGVEVVVQFVDGDPDRPLVMGCLYNADNPPPRDLPAEKTKSGIKSNSSPGGGGFNEIRFEDAAGAEQIFVHGQKDYDRVSERCESHTVGVDQTIAIGANQTQTIGANQTESVGANQALDVGANRAITVGGSFVETIGGSSTITVDGHATETLNAGETRDVTAGHEETISGGETRTVTGGQTETISGGATRTLDGGHTQTVSGGCSATVNGATGWVHDGSLTQDVTGAITVTTPSSYDLTALGGFTLSCPAGGTILALAGWDVISPGGKTWVDSVNDWLGGQILSAKGLGISLTGAKVSVTGMSASVTGLSASAQGLSLEVTDASFENEPIELNGAGAVLQHIGLRLHQAGLYLAM